MRINHVGLHSRDVCRSVYLVFAKGRIPHRAECTEAVFLPKCKAYAVDDGPFNLSLRQLGIDRLPTVHSRDEFDDVYPARLGIDFYLGKLGDERRWRFCGKMRGFCLYLEMVLSIQRVVRDLLIGHFPGFRGALHSTGAEHKGFRIGAEHFSGYGENLPLDFLRAFPHRLARNIGRGGSVGSNIEGCQIGVRREHHDMFHRDVEHLGGNLGQDGIGAGADVGRTDIQPEGTVFVHLHRRAAHVNARDARSLHGDG